MNKAGSGFLGKVPVDSGIEKKRKIKRQILSLIHI